MSKVSDGRSVRVGSVGPKLRPEGVSDGHPVNSPEPPERSDGGKQQGRPARYWIRVRSGKALRSVGKSAGRAEPGASRKA